VIISLTMDSFIVWMQKEMNARNWKQADLARSANLDSALISMLINGKRKPGEVTCNAIASAFNIPAETVFRIAGLLHSDDPQEHIKRLGYKFEQLSERDQEEILALMDFKIQQAQVAKRKKTGPLGGGGTL
jgi:transcriptional regulator with XRE-family HTH domain